MTRTSHVLYLSGLALLSGCSSVDRSLTNEVNSKISAIANEDTNARPLVEVKQARLTGLINETETQKNELLEKGRQYLLFRQRKIPLAKHKAMIATCEKAPDENPFCALIDKEGAERRRSRRKPRLSSSAARKIAKELVTAKIDALKTLSESELIQGLKKINEIEKLDRVNTAALESDGCVSSALLTALGLKAEMGFPEQKYRDFAEKLYSRSLTCKPDVSTSRAAFRLGLLLVWKGAFAEAEQTLAKISDDPEAGDFTLRAVYWRLHCAHQTKNSKLERQMKERLVREFPLSLHALVAAGDAVMKNQVISRAEPMALFRSSKRTDLNAPVRGAEAMLALGSTEAAFELVKPILDDVLEAESGFVLYMATILMRTDDTLAKFQLITTLFRKDPSLITKSTLEMLYPLKNLEIVKTQPSALDPFLILSLIRQESAFNTRAHSSAGAMGLMQLMPRTARLFSRVPRARLYDPETNVKIGVRYFSNLVSRYNGDVELALASYNAGVLRVDDWLKRYPVDNRFLFLDLIPFKETREYVASIARNYYWYMKLYADEVKPADPDNKTPVAQQASVRSISGVLSQSDDSI